MDVAKELDKIAREQGITLEEVKEKYSLYLGLEPETKPNREEAALRRVKSYYKRILGRVREIGFFKGMLVGARDLVEIFQQMREKALRQAEIDEERAIANGYIAVEAGQRVPLDYRRRVFGRDNPNYGKPLVGESWQRDLYVIVRREETEPYEFKVLRATDNLARDLKLPKFFSPIAFRASIRRESLGLLSITRFLDTSIEKFNPEEIIRGTMPCYRAGEVESYVDSVEEKMRRNIICIEGWLLSEGAAKKTKYVDIHDPDKAGYIRCFYRGDLGIDYGPDSRVLAIATPMHSRTGTGIIASLFGIYAPPEDRYPKEEV